MQRAAIYARFSTDQQSERSIEDQIALCRSYAKTQKLQVVAEFADRARSGGSMFGREGLAEMLAGARESRFEVLIVEALDRLSRDMEDLAGMHKRLTFAGIKIQAVNEGEANTVLVGLRGLVGQLFREDGVQKTRRGMAGRVRDGLSAGGRAYGYRRGEKTGTLEIIEAEAEIVRRIFREFIAGKKPREIAHALNREKVKAPRGKKWNASTINGSAQRHNGILRGEIYDGRIVWNRVRMVKDPETGKRVSRPNPREQWQTVEAPALAILDRGIFAKAQRRKEETAHEPATNQKRAKTILSGLLRCGCCGSGLSIKGKDARGRTRVRCTGVKEGGACTGTRTFLLKSIERRVLDALHEELRNPQAIAEFAAAYREEKRKLARERAGGRAKQERRLGEVERELSRIVDAIAQGIAVATIRERAEALEAERQQLQDALQAKVDAEIVELHPAALGNYEARLSEIKARIESGLAAGDSEAAAAVREIIDSVIVKPRGDGKPGSVIEIVGRLDPLYGPLLAGHRKAVGFPMVAGGRYSQKAHTFRIVA